MKAIVQDKYGEPKAVLSVQEIAKPAVKDGEVLVRVRAASIHVGDWLVVTGAPYIARPAYGKPRGRVPGTDIAGTVEAVGNGVTNLKPGDEVYGWCAGAFAEYACAPADHFVPKPTNLTLEQAAAVGVSASTALQLLRDQGKIQPGQKVLINGASGGVGTFAVQIAKAFGADVTGVCSTKNVEMVRSIGADHVIDYTKEDFTRSGQRYDFILDNVANHSLANTRRVLTPTGKLQSNNGTSGGPWFGTLATVIKTAAASMSSWRGSSPEHRAVRAFSIAPISAPPAPTSAVPWKWVPTAASTWEATATSVCPAPRMAAALRAESPTALLRS